MTETRIVEGHEVTFSTVNMGVTRWVFSGCINAGGYKTADYAAVEAAAQIQGRLQGRLAAEHGHTDVPQKLHRATWKAEVAPVASLY